MEGFGGKESKEREGNAIAPEKLANMSKILDAVGIRDEESLANLVAAAVKSVAPKKTEDEPSPYSEEVFTILFKKVCW